MYELTYDIYLNEKWSSITSPCSTLSVVTTRMDGYREMGGNSNGSERGQAGMDDGHACAGGRWMGLVGSNLFGRKRWRNCVSTRPGPGRRPWRNGSGLPGQPRLHAASAWSESREDGVADRSGSGACPVGTQGAIFVNGNADIRNEPALNGSIGYRYDF